MYLPSLENRTSDIEDIISEKKDLDEGSSSCSNSAQTLATALPRFNLASYVSHAGRKAHFLAYLQAL